MIHSMTGYARKEFKGDWGTAVWEIRSVNQRYLETYLRLPEQLRGLEPILRERFRKQLERGKVECNLRFESQTNAGQLQINEALAEQLIDSALWVIDRAGQGQLNPVDVLRWPGVMAAPEQDMDELNTRLLTGFDEVLALFIESRQWPRLHRVRLQRQTASRLLGISGALLKQLRAAALAAGEHRKVMQQGLKQRRVIAGIAGQLQYHMLDLTVERIVATIGAGIPTDRGIGHDV